MRGFRPPKSKTNRQLRGWGCLTPDHMVWSTPWNSDTSLESQNVHKHDLYPLPGRKFFDGPLQHIENQIGFWDVLRDQIPRKAVSQPWSSEYNGAISKIIGNSVQICFLSRFHSTFEVPPLYQNMLTQTSAPDGSTLGTHWLSIAPSCHSHRKCGEHQLLQ